ncbi:YkvA family protein [Mariprofundus ferrooxydans]|uniref:DUF1232 domain-containing protein n=1 Tax=Mariprofundus ferrooxydans PV-1 TaxID=314345 RepID=Q0F1N6_9PROT|nr:YkvA family protein [Mariprofundus ferrooxydans]EAU55155.1 hypothetical protein SPV1_10501 [Mariprofundus ferrooxydans PV-1]
MMLKQLKNWAKSIERDIMALYLAARDSRVPWYAKALAAFVAAYALSPIDLIPDFIPVIGYLDDLIIVPLGIMLVIRMIPAGVMNDLRKRGDEMLTERPRSIIGAVFVVLIWLVCLTWAGWIIWKKG